MPEYYLALLHEINGHVCLDYTAKLKIESAPYFCLRQNLSAVMYPFKFYQAFRESGRGVLSKAAKVNEVVVQASHWMEGIQQNVFEQSAGYGRIHVQEILATRADTIIFLIQQLLVQKSVIMIDQAHWLAHIYFKSNTSSNAHLNPYLSPACTNILASQSICAQAVPAFLFLDEHEIDSVRNLHLSENMSLKTLYPKLKAASDLNVRTLYEIQYALMKTHHWHIQARDITHSQTSVARSFLPVIPNPSKKPMTRQIVLLYSNLVFRFFVARMLSVSKVQFKQRLLEIKCRLNESIILEGFVHKVKHRLLYPKFLSNVISKALDAIQKGGSLAQVCKNSHLLNNKKWLMKIRKMDFIELYLRLEEKLLSLESVLMQVDSATIQEMPDLVQSPRILWQFKECFEVSQQLGFPMDEGFDMRLGHQAKPIPQI